MMHEMHSGHEKKVRNFNCKPGLGIRSWKEPNDSAHWSRDPETLNKQTKKEPRHKNQNSRANYQLHLHKL